MKKSLIAHVALAFFFSGSLGCREGASVTGCVVPEAIAVPVDIPESYLLEWKNGEAITGRGREEYQWGYKEGWLECCSKYSKGDVSVLRSDAEPVGMQEPIYASRGRSQGFSDCKERLGHASRNAGRAFR